MKDTAGIHIQDLTDVIVMNETTIYYLRLRVHSFWLHRLLLLTMMMMMLNVHTTVARICSYMFLKIYVCRLNTLIYFYSCWSLLLSRLMTLDELTDQLTSRSNSTTSLINQNTISVSNGGIPSCCYLDNTLTFRKTIPGNS